MTRILPVFSVHSVHSVDSGFLRAFRAFRGSAFLRAFCGPDLSHGEKPRNAQNQRNSRKQETVMNRNNTGVIKTNPRNPRLTAQNEKAPGIPEALFVFSSYFLLIYPR